jgi:hypothetical protein
LGIDPVRRQHIHHEFAPARIRCARVRSFLGTESVPDFSLPVE